MLIQAVGVVVVVVVVVVIQRPNSANSNPKIRCRWLDISRDEM